MILAVLQARMASPRLPGKALAPLHGQPMIVRQLERIRRARCIGRVVVATSVHPDDDPLSALLVSRGVTVFRGAAENLADRYLRCLEAAGPVTHLVRIKGDSPFVDPAVIDETVRLALASRAAYASNRVEPTYPRGLEVEVVTAAALAEACAAIAPQAVAETTPFAWTRARPDRFALAHVRARRDWSHLDWRVKRPADLAFARNVYDALHPSDPGFGFEAVLDLLHGRVDLGRWAA